MAKQTFTTGQVLTAAQMTSLQQTAMLGGAASAKTASYTLVAADAGTAISMNNAGATTITVNTGLFAAGDTVHITNLGAGVCTITAGTATVNSSASLALAQYESGFLDFTTTGAAIFVKGAGAAPSSGGMTLLSTTTLTGSSVTLSSIPSGYVSLYLELENVRPSDDDTSIFVRVNGDSTANRYIENATIANFGYPFNTTVFRLMQAIDNGASGLNQSFTVFPNYDNTTNWKVAQTLSVMSDATTPTYANFFNDIIGIYNQTTAITSLVISPSGGTFTSGTALLYGVK